MSARKLLLVSISVMSINASVYGEEWGVVKCRTQCTQVSCADAAKKELCQTNCGHHEPSILDTCNAAKSQVSPEVGRTAPPKRDLPSVPLKKTAELTEPTLDEGGNQPLPKKERSRPQAQRFSKPPLETAVMKPSHSQKPSGLLAGEKIGTVKEAQEDVSQATKLLKAQVDMLKEAVKQAEVCYQMGRDVAKEAAKDPIKFEEDIKSEERGKDSIFPNVYVSIFDKNPNFVMDTLDPTKMDQQSFVFHLKEQRKTTGVNLADMLKEILSWKDASKIEKYKKDISGDLRALSSFCNAPNLMLRQAIKHKQEKLKEESLAAKDSEKKPNIFTRAKNKITGK